VNTVDFSAVERAGRKTKVADERAEFVIDHTGEDDSGERTAIENKALRCTALMQFDRFKKKFKVEGGVMSYKREVAAEVREGVEYSLDVGLIGHHFIVNAIDGGGSGGNRSTGVDECAEGVTGFAIDKTHGTHFDDGICSGLDSGGFEIKGYKVHGLMCTGSSDSFQEVATIIRGPIRPCFYSGLNEAAVIPFKLGVFTHNQNT